MIWALQRLLTVETEKWLNEVTSPLDVPTEIEFTRTLHLLSDQIHDLIFQQVFSEPKGYHPPVIIDVSKGEPSRDYELAERSSRLSKYRGDSESGNLIGNSTDSSTFESDIDTEKRPGPVDDDQLLNFSDDDRTFYASFPDRSGD